jgi:hypothetical protein
MRSFRFAPHVFLVGLLISIGCNRGPQLSEVEGTVKLKGKPLDRIQVEFWPEGNGPRSIGETDSQGRYTLMTDDGKKKGAVIGSHKVLLRDVGVLGEKFLGRAGESVDMTKGKKPRITDPRYSDPHQTPLKKEVTGGKNVIDLDLPSQ